MLVTQKQEPRVVLEEEKLTMALDVDEVLVQETQIKDILAVILVVTDGLVEEEEVLVLLVQIRALIIIQQEQEVLV